MQRTKRISIRIGQESKCKKFSENARALDGKYKNLKMAITNDLDGELTEWKLRREKHMDKSLENLDLLKSVKEIDDILNQYRQLGYIDRDKAILKIRELRVTNKSVYESAMATPLSNYIPFIQASDEQLARELESDKMILIENYVSNAIETSN